MLTNTPIRASGHSIAQRSREAPERASVNGSAQVLRPLDPRYPDPLPALGQSVFLIGATSDSAATRGWAALNATRCAFPAPRRSTRRPREAAPEEGSARPSATAHGARLLLCSPCSGGQAGSSASQRRERESADSARKAASFRLTEGREYAPRQREGRNCRGACINEGIRSDGLELEMFP